MPITQGEINKTLFTTLSSKKVLLLNPNWRKSGDAGFFVPNHPVAPLEFLYIKGVLEEKGIPAYLLDLWQNDSDIKHYHKVIKECAYVVITTAPTYMFWRDGATDVSEIIDSISDIKAINPRIKSVLIGPQGTSVPKMIVQDNVDFIIRGEPDLVLADLIVEDLSPVPDYSKIDGVCYRTETDFIYSSTTVVVNDMSKLPILTYPEESLGSKGHPAAFDRGFKKSTVYEASRGCAFSCIFCWRDGFRDKLRTKSIEQIEQEIALLAKKDAEYIYFIDEIFGYTPGWTEQLCDILRKYNMKWACQTHPEILSPSFIDKISECGCIGIEIGLENIDASVLKNLGKASINVNEVKLNLKYLLTKDIRVRLFLILGAPGDKKSLATNLYNFLKDLCSENLFICPQIISPLPNTPLWRLANKKGADLKRWNDIHNYAGIIDNEFTKPIDVFREIYRINSLFRSLKAKRSLMKANSINVMLKGFIRMIIYYIFSFIPLLYYRLVQLRRILLSYKSGKKRFKLIISSNKHHEKAYYS